MNIADVQYLCCSYKVLYALKRFCLYVGCGFSWYGVTSAYNLNLDRNHILVCLELRMYDFNVALQR